MTKWVRFRLRMVPALVGVLTLAACGDGTSPSTEFDAQATADAMESMVAATDGLGEAFGSMELAAPLFASTTAGDLLAGGDGVVLPDVNTSRRVAETVASEPFFPSNVLGVTFVWDEVEGGYVADDGGDAPADGIRVIYYAIDPFTRQPASPLTPLGYVEVRDLSSPSSSRLGVKVKRTTGDEATLADYYIDTWYTASQSEVQVHLTSVGFLSNGTDQLNFDLSQDVVVSESGVELTQDFGMDLEGSEVSVRYQGQLTGGFGDEMVALALTTTIENGPDRVVLELAMDAESLAGSIHHNGETVALIGGTPSAPTFTDGAGNPLTEAELTALQDLWLSVNALFELVDGVFGPVGA